jgi:hypothetical protein
MKPIHPAVKKSLNYSFWLLAAGLALNAIHMHNSALKAALLPSKVVPYTVVLQDYAIQASGEVPSRKLTMAVRADGSRAVDITSDDPGKTSERILTFSSGKTIYIMEKNYLKSSTYDLAKRDPNRWLANPNDSCLVRSANSQPDVIGEETVGGYRTIKLSVKLSGGTNTEWLALDYGCALVKDRFEWGDGQVSGKKLIALIPGNPAPSLFDDPAGFEEVPPSRMFPGANSDSYYYSHRPPDSPVNPQ